MPLADQNPQAPTATSEPPAPAAQTATANSSASPSKIELQPKPEAKNVPTVDMIPKFLKEIILAGHDDGDAWAKFENLSWCRQQLGLRNALVRKLKIWETQSDYAQTYSILTDGEHGNYLILKDIAWTEIDAFAKQLLSIEEAHAPPPKEEPLETSPVQNPQEESTSASGDDTSYYALERNECKSFSYKTGHLNELPGSAPQFLLVKGEKYALGGKWANLPIAVCDAIEASRPGKVREVVDAGEISGFSLSSSGMRRPEFVKSFGFWREKNYSATDFVRITRTLFRLCGIDLSNASIVFSSRSVMEVHEPKEKYVVDAKPQVATAHTPAQPKDAQDCSEDPTEADVNDYRSRKIKEYIEKNPGCAKQKVIEDLSNENISKVLTRLVRHPEVIEVEDRLYVKESILDFDEAADILLEALDGLFTTNGGYTSAHELYQAVQLKLDDFFYDNDAFDSERQVYDIAVYLFGKLHFKGRHHVFKGNMHIWRETPDYPMADTGLLIHWARMNGGVLTRQLGYDNLERRGALGPGKTAIFSIAFNKIRDKFWVLSDDEFLLKEGFDINTQFVSDVKGRLDELLAIEEREDGLSFIPMGMIGDDFFDGLPPLPVGRPWSIQFLQEVIADHSAALHYKTIARSSFTGRSHAAIVPCDSEYQDFSDLAYAAVRARNAKPSVMFSRSQFIDFLKDTGLYPEDMAGSSIDSTLKDNIHFKWMDKNNLVVS